MKKTFDCVAFQRQVRDKLGNELLADRDRFLRQLKKIRRLHSPESQDRVSEREAGEGSRQQR